MRCSARWWLVTATMFYAVSSSQGSKNCEKLIREIADLSAKYIQCITVHGSPVTICVDCVSQFKQTENKYEEFLKGNDSNVACPDIYIDRDKLNIVAHTHEIISNLWDEASCRNCYNSDGTTNDETNNFTRLAIDYETCESHNSELCIECKGAYSILNAMFETLKEKYKHLVCFDIEDKMNRTRANWTQTCGHETPKGSLVAFAAVSSALTSIPLLFYCAFFLYARRQENEHIILDEPSTSRTDDVTGCTSHVALLNTPSTSSGAIENNVNAKVDFETKSKLIDLDDNDDILS